MSGQEDKTKGRVKEAVGDLTDDDSMKKEGKVQETAGKAKDAVDDAKDWAQDKIDDHRH